MAVAEARARILALMKPVGREIVPLADAVGRVLAEPVIANRTQPPFAASAMDGYAVRAAEVLDGAQFRVTGEAAAGHPFDGAVPEGCALRIFTGAPIPAPLDRIIIQEDVERDGDVIRLSATLDPGPYVRPAGLDFRSGETLLDAPRRLSPEDIALAAATGCALLTCYRRPRVALLATGDELVLPGQETPEGAIISSNNFGLCALLKRAEADPFILPIAHDSPAALERAAHDAAGADLFVTLGGASVGEHDLIRPVLAQHGLELDLYRIAMRPGKPLMAGRLGTTPMLGLPGNPVSAMVCGRIFLLPVIDALSGLNACELKTFEARLVIALSKNSPREHYMRARVEDGPDGAICTPFESQDSSRLRLLSGANALMVREPNDPPRAVGAPVSYIPL